MVENLFILSGILLIGSFIQALSGFGLGLFSIAILSLFFAPGFSAPLAVCYGFLITIPLVTRMRKHIHWQTGLLLSLASWPGAFLGTLLLKSISRDYFLLFVGFFLVLTSAYSIFGNTRKTSTYSPLISFAINSGVGLFSGFLGTAIGVSGPPVVLWLNTRTTWSDLNIKATLSVFFFLQGLGALTGYAINGLFTGEVLRLLFLASPGFIIGTTCGLLGFEWLHRRGRDYRRMVHYILIAAGLWLFLQGLSLLLK